MSVDEMKKEITEQIETLDETQLNELKNFIERIIKIPVGEWNLEHHVKSIVEEREELLKRLAK
jgi:hypothetical protein